MDSTENCEFSRIDPISIRPSVIIKNIAKNDLIVLINSSGTFKEILFKIGLENNRQNKKGKYRFFRIPRKTRKVVRPFKEELEKLVWEKPTTHIARDFGMSDKGIEKWCKEYNIQKPSRGYWAKLKAKK